MSKTLLKKLKLGILSLSAFGLLAACAEQGIEEDPNPDDPATAPIEEPADAPVEDPSGMTP